MERVKSIFKDLFYCLVTGSKITLLLSVIFGLIGLIFCKGNLYSAVEVIRSVLFMVGGAGLFLGSFLIIRKKDELSNESLKGWRKKFITFSFKGAVITVSIVVILYASVVDWITFYAL